MSLAIECHEEPRGLDRAVLEYAAAVYDYRQGRHRQAHEHLDRAGATLLRLNDAGLLAQVDETRARVFVAEKNYREAKRVIERAVEALEKGAGGVPLAEALTTQGVVLARLGDGEGSRLALRRAMEEAEWAGAPAHAGQAALTLIEEHGESLALRQSELSRLYARADELLADAPGAEALARLLACARIVLRRLAGPQLQDKDFTFHGAVHEFEAKIIERALEEAEGSVTQAAKLLGVTHQTFTTMLNKRHQHLLDKRTPLKRRLRSIIKGRKARA